MLLSIKKSYYAMYYLFEFYYFNVDKLDDLGAILDPISPFLFDGGMPADQAKWSDWIDVLKKFGVTEIEGDCLEDDKAFEASIAFLTFHYETYEFELLNVINYLLDDSARTVELIWKESVKKAIETDDYYLRNCELS